MTIAANLGFPRIGLKRELKKAVESYWKGSIAESELQEIAKELRQKHWKIQEQAGIKHIPSNDFSLYDHVLDTISMVGAVPQRYNFTGNKIDTDLYFAMSRGRQDQENDVVAMEMTKWFDTNYHYIVPEFTKDANFKLCSNKILEEYKEAKALGIETRPVLLGPVSFLLLGKAYDDFSPLALLDKLLPIYEQVLNQLQEAGVNWVQIDEPCLVLDLKEKAKQAYKTAYNKLSKEFEANIMLTTYFDELGDNLELATSLPVEGLHIDLVRAPWQLDEVIEKLGNDKYLSLGLVDGRNIWKNNFSQSLEIAKKAVAALGKDRIIIAPSSSLLHSPIDLDEENELDGELKNWLSFAKQKLDEVAIISRILNEESEEFVNILKENLNAIQSRQESSKVHNKTVKDRVNNLAPKDSQRTSPFKDRIEAQTEELKLPLLPITTIGSFPQTKELRKIRADFKKGEITQEKYDKFLSQKTNELIKWKEDIGIDVPVHGEYERNDMVEYFGEQLQGYAFTKNGCVQSYGSRCVKPPIIFGDVSRPKAMTVYWTSYAQKLTKKPVKGMLTGPITMLQWAFVRDDQPRNQTCKQIAIAISDEVKDLEKAGINIIQIDEPAFREGLPLRNKNKDEYLKWAVEAFRISSSNIKNSTQIHTHMCYSEFRNL